jgi:hypothetical protein
MKYHAEYVADGYEGLMIRNKAGVYILKNRSNDLLKLKNFEDDEYDIVGATTPTTGKECGCIIFELATLDGTRFTCRPEGSYDQRKIDYQSYTANPSDFIGKKYTVKFQERDSRGVPRFPTGMGIRLPE